MFSYFPGGKNFGETNMGKSNLGQFIQNDFLHVLDNILWFGFPVMPRGSMPGQPYFGPGLPMVNPYSNNPKIVL